ncbi:MAG: sigma-70 family RNA polymerase sigma factor [Oscillospiraceae bacterium]|nr:sigma-70 family RNA polymerase sigma factor [Oscillospiraceae bacterium]
MLGKVEICGVNTANLPTLSQEETDALLRRVREGDREARSRLIEGNLRLVLSVIQRFAARRSQKGESCDDLFQVGCIGLIKAIDNFDVEQNVRFSTYGVPMIIGWRKSFAASKEDLTMTRKEALALAIRVLSEIGDSGENEEAARVLNGLAEELPLTRWTEAAIRDSVEQFILEQGRVPTVTDFKKRGLPPHTVIRQRYGIPLRAWLDRCYPLRKASKEEIHKRATESFVRDYLRLRAGSAEAYNRGRGPGLPCWYTIAKYNGVRSWRALLEKLALPLFVEEDPAEERTVFHVRVMSDIAEGQRGR